MNKDKQILKCKNNCTLKFILLIIVLFVITTVCITFGSVKIDVDVTFKSLINNILNKEIFAKDWPNNIDNIVFKLRLPRLLLAIVSGGALALVGILMQTLTRNSLADPYILGISSGASAGATLSIVLGILSSFGHLGIALGAFLGSLIASIMVFKISGVSKVYSKTKLILTGVAVSSIFTAVTNFIITFAKNDSLVKSAVFWTIGSLAGANYNQVKFSLVIMVITSILSMLLYKDLDAMLLGEAVAKNIGINTKFIIRFIMIASTLLTGTIVAFTGVIGFVGLIVPHIARQMVGSSHKKLIPFGIVIGSILMVITDTIARTVLSPQEVPIGVITAFLGGPFFLYLMQKSTYRFGGK
ncbi:FecCD family ABC transporter permease [Clostridium sporogenes]|uniref:FecCD family ABC transporter permease n=1 Tax=Clostridium sporogenes TaxID=1509 RepID=UPI00024BA54E|nr:iron ABC transporter permease [Clostridium sporogenes]EHN15018.1 iron chelate ABC transporter permease protein [Clostridium sporogenes PA 3679]MCW6062297.1 iron ABC transporter permease [Clostridium sporogenes]MCW6067931.1 iron ABC transporter permease [Clostridium sporogenes]MCW6107927.1 iron ABC transporter permease [Clostridium sporogenes]NFF68049.1 iron ABC transporter permease [Clostridium sporogenes]